MKRVLLTAAAAAATVTGAFVATHGSGRPATAAPATPATAAAPAHALPATAPGNARAGDVPATATPIKHVVVIFGENVSYDHYFGTYPMATNPAGEPSFTARPATPTPNGLNEALLSHNPNMFDPTRLDRSQAVTCDQDHAYKPEQQAADHGLMDKFVEYTDSGDCSARYTGEYYRPGLVMDYYDGNTVTGMWNYAQHYAMSDNSYGTTYGPSTPGALNLISGQTNGATTTAPTTSVPNGTVIGDPDSTLDGCGKGVTAQLSGKNVGDLLSAKGVTWGWFQGGFTPTSHDSTGKPVCGAQHANIAGAQINDYSAHHEPFQYYKSTANTMHVAPSSDAMIGKSDRANHQYDLTSFWTAADRGAMPAVSFLKAPAYQDGHAGNSDPLDEQTFVVNTLNKLQRLPSWKDTAVVLAYDDSDGWYDHVLAPVLKQSQDPANDALSADGACGTQSSTGDIDRCGYGPRLPLLIVSPYAKTNFVDHSLTDQTSITRFIEDNWGLGQIGHGSFDELAGSMNGMFDFHRAPNRRNLILDPTTGAPRG